MIVKNSRRVDFYTHVVATTPKDSSSRRRIWRYGERSFSSMRTASLRGFLTSGRRSRGRRSDLLKLPITVREGRKGVRSKEKTDKTWLEAQVSRAKKGCLRPHFERFGKNGYFAKL